MRKLSRNVAALAAGITLSVAACGGDDGPTGSNAGDALTSAEAQELASVLFDELAGFFVFGFGGSPSRTAPLFNVAVPINETVNVSEPCLGGGSIGVAGSITGDINELNGQGTVTMDLTESINGCVVNGTTTTFTVNSSPDIRMTGDFTIGSASISASFSISGGLSFTSEDGRSGSCAIDMSVSVSGSGTGSSQSISGTVCGQSITQI